MNINKLYFIYFLKPSFLFFLKKREKLEQNMEFCFHRGKIIIKRVHNPPLCTRFFKNENFHFFMHGNTILCLFSPKSRNNILANYVLNIWPFENKLSQYVPELSQFGHARENIRINGNLP